MIPDLLQEYSVALGEVLDVLGGPKDVIIHGELLSKINAIVDMRLFRAHGVEKLYRFEDGLHGRSTSETFFINTDLKVLRMVLDHVRAARQRSGAYRCNLVFVPRKTALVDALLEEEGCFDTEAIRTSAFRLDSIPLDYSAPGDSKADPGGLYSLDMAELDLLASLKLNQDTSLCKSLCLAACDLLLAALTQRGERDAQYSFKLENVHMFGAAAHFVWDMFQSQFLQKLLEASTDVVKEETNVASARGTKPTRVLRKVNFLLLSRDVDILTPLLTQLTYEGALDECLPSRCGEVHVRGDAGDAAKQPASSGDGAQKAAGFKLVLNVCRDPVYAELRGMHMAFVGEYFSRKARELKSGYARKEDARDVNAMKQFVQTDLKLLRATQKLVQNHMTAAEYIVREKSRCNAEELLKVEHAMLAGIINAREAARVIHDLIVLQNDSGQALRLVCVFSLVYDHERNPHLTALINAYLNSFGVEHLITFQKLATLGVFDLDEINPANSAGTPSDVGPANVAGVNAVQQLFGEKLKLANRKVNADTASGNAGNGARSDGFRFSHYKKKLACVTKDASSVNLATPTDSSYVFSGVYSPVSVKLLDMITNYELTLVAADSGVPPSDNPILRSGVKLRYTQTAIRSNRNTTQSDATSAPKRIELVHVIYFLGGCTYAELDALRVVERVANERASSGNGPQVSIRFVVLTTNVTNWRKVLDSKRIANDTAPSPSLFGPLVAHNPNCLLPLVPTFPLSNGASA